MDDASSNPVRIKCHRCGKLTPSVNGERRILCTACGRWIDVPPPLVSATAPHPSPSAAATNEPVVLQPQPSYAPARRASSRPLERTPGSSLAMWIIVWVGCGLLLVGTIALFLYQQPGSWERANGPELLSLKQDAERLVREGKLADAHVVYQKIQQKAAGRTLRDENLRQQLQAAGVAQEKVFLALLDSMRSPETGTVPISPEMGTVPIPATQSADADQGPSFTPPQVVNPPAVLVPATQPVATTQPVDVTPVTPVSPVTPPAPAVERRRPPAQRWTVPADGITDEQIGEGIRRGVDYLLSQFQNGQLRDGAAQGGQYAGANALAVYALLQCSMAISDERLNIRAPQMKQLVDRMRDMPVGPNDKNTYTRGIRATALAVYNRAEDREALKRDAAWLIDNQAHGAYTYDAVPNYGNRTPTYRAWDNSNSQYGLLGVWSAAEVGIEVPQAYWRLVENHWFEEQCENGQWSYRGPGRTGTMSMTVAGLASLFVTHDYLDAPRGGDTLGRDPFSLPLARGLAWLETGNNAVDVRGGYALYGLERVGLASGFKYFGNHDWYRLLAAQVLRMQSRNGDIGGLVDTCYCLLFLARGRHPILMNKLRFDGAWTNRSRDVANLARFASRELERPLNWQVVPLSRDWPDWTDCPILYIASHNVPKFTDGDYFKLRSFINAGGMIFVHADGGHAPMNQWAVDLAKKVTPQYEWTTLPPAHPIYTINYKVDPRPPLKCISNGVRILMLHSPEDISRFWQIRGEKSRRNVFELGTNLFIYASGKRDFRNRLSSTVLPAPPAARVHFRIPLARVKYGGNWDPEPGAFDRFSRWFTYQTGYALDVVEVDVAQLDPAKHPIAHITGTAAFTPAQAAADALRKYVEEGGLLLSDAAGGSGEFDASMGALFQRIFPNQRPARMAADHPLLMGEADGMDKLPTVLLRPYAEAQVGRGTLRITTVSAGKGIVVHSSLDLTAGLLDTPTWGVLGYRPDFAQSFLKNAVLWAVDR